MRPDDAVASKLEERRQDVRLAGNGPVQAVVVDCYSQPLRVLQDAQTVNVSAGGLALLTSTPASPGERVVVTLEGARLSQPGAQRVVLEALAVRRLLAGQTMVNCRLVEGRMPAKLIYGW
ncbi:MAG: PilZ domain-containing protein [Phycisphaeraceae bacterium]|nr:PilZ domain-containing protein [Phycisphaeraceae bacterium]